MNPREHDVGGRLANDLPDTLLAARPSLGDYIRHLATHGEHGEVDVEAEVRRLIEAAGRQYSTERTRPDGRVIEVRANPVPGGGVVINYSDITERKRAEAEIRAARDAAETTLHELEAGAGRSRPRPGRRRGSDASQVDVPRQSQSLPKVKMPNRDGFIRFPRDPK